MANDCLKKKLHGIATNPDLIKVTDAEFELQVQNKSEIALTYATKANQVLKIVGDGYFMDKSTSTNVGKTITSGEANTLLDFFVHAEKTCKLIVPNYADVKNINLYYTSASPSTFPKGWSSLTELRSNRVQIETSNVPSTLTVLNACYLNGDIELLPASIPANYVTAKSDTATQTAEIFGNMAKMPTGIFWFATVGGEFTWSGMLSGRTVGLIITRGGNAGTPPDLGNDVDAYLNDIATLPRPNVGAAYLLTININGTRTSSSDAAIENLKGKAYKVIVNGETL